MKPATETALREAGVDLDGALNRFANNDALYEKFLTKFLTDDTYRMIAPALEGGNAEDAFRATHTLKGVAANLGMNRLSDTCTAVVASLRMGDIDAARQQYAAIASSYEEICNVLTAEFGSGG